MECNICLPFYFSSLISSDADINVKYKFQLRRALPQHEDNLEML